MIISCSNVQPFYISIYGSSNWNDISIAINETEKQTKKKEKFTCDNKYAGTKYSTTISTVPLVKLILQYS